MLFSQYANKCINFAEIGIEDGASLKMWRKYFISGNIYAFELYDTKLKNCMDMNIENIKYNKIDVSDIDNFNVSFSNTEVLFDIIIDDSSHIIEHQNNIINNAHKYLRSGGILIIEDIERNTNNSFFHINDNYWSYYTFIICHHDNRNCHDNDKILYLIKR